MKREKIVVCFSGGRTSGFMSYWLKTNMSHLYDFIFVYANTGLEHEKTLEFVNECDKYLKLNLVWIEADIKNGDNADYVITNYKNACRDNRLFKDMCKVYGLPNGIFMHCTRELKNRPIRKFAVDIIGYDYRIALGIRHDEIKKRLKAREDAIYPLATIGKFTKQDILKWWKDQLFDLEIPEHLGNCKACFKKSDKKLQMVAQDMPQAFDDMIDLENEFSYLKSKSEDEPRKIYRHFRTAYEVKNNLNLPKNMQEFDECAEECGSVFSDYESIKIIANEKSLFDFIN